MELNEDVLKQREVISALADGQLRGDAFALAVQSATGADADAGATWDTYHLIGDVLRTGARDARTCDAAFMARLSARLAAEPAVLRPAVVAESAMSSPVQAASDLPVKARAEAANAPNYRWKMLAGVASLAAVAAIGWNIAGSVGNAQPQLALVPVPPVAVAPATGAMAVAQSEPAPQSSSPVMIRDPRLDELLAAHKQFGGNSALQMPAGFLRNATFEGSGR